jgi:hypothetical protein
VSTDTVDGLAESSSYVADALTIDVEGAELEVLRGAKDVLKLAEPIVWVSVHPDLMEKNYGSTPADLNLFMERLNYRGELLASSNEEHFLFRKRW